MKVNQEVPRYTYQDYAQWEGRWELIDGYPYAMSPSPKRKHQRLSSAIFREISGALSANSNCNCEVLYELDWVIDADTVVRPDIVVVCGHDESDFIQKVPALIVEVISETTSFKDRNTKFDLYQQQGVRYYLLADYIKNTLEIFELINNRYKSDDSLKRFHFPEGCEVEINFRPGI